ncbi:hypothetical protein [Pseudomonas sp. CCI1.1]|uniref:hypothetical protein n=1 Tax=Pseudomonas sp. CCI1.1 TaxID=3048613 RepID=UPI000B152B6C|nr:hypothetical protein [Pseudomonas sp. CCI1.1]WPX49877.1 hypothetical protein RHM69_06555 [Pseudomonas sp. CCI1.1]
MKIRLTGCVYFAIGDKYSDHRRTWPSPGGSYGNNWPMSRGMSGFSICSNHCTIPRRTGMRRLIKGQRLLGLSRQLLRRCRHYRQLSP